MPGSHLDAFVLQCYDDVGGCDFWQSSFYNATMQWWVGWHSTKPFERFHLTRSSGWSLIGYELWNKQPPYLVEAYYASPNPSTTIAGSDLTPQGHYHIYLDDEGEVTNSLYSDQILTWLQEESFIKGKGKGKGHQSYWFPGPSSKGKGPKGSGKKGWVPKGLSKGKKGETSTPKGLSKGKKGKAPKGSGKA